LLNLHYLPLCLLEPFGLETLLLFLLALLGLQPFFLIALALFWQPRVLVPQPTEEALY